MATNQQSTNRLKTRKSYQYFHDKGIVFAVFNMYCLLTERHILTVHSKTPIKKRSELNIAFNRWFYWHQRVSNSYLNNPVLPIFIEMVHSSHYITSRGIYCIMIFFVFNWIRKTPFIPMFVVASSSCHRIYGFLIFIVYNVLYEKKLIHIKWIQNTY